MKVETQKINHNEIDGAVRKSFLSFGLAPVHGNPPHGTFSRRQEAFYYRNIHLIYLATSAVRVPVLYGLSLFSIRRTNPQGVIWDTFSLHAAL